MEQIRVSKGIEIGVNDNGDTITLDVNNALFLKKYNAMISTLTKLANEIESIEDDAKTDEEQVEIVTDTMKRITSEIDVLIGENTCKKVFGDIVPLPFAVLEFLEQLNPIIEKYAKAKSEKINTKYNTNRKGGKRV